LKPPSPPNKFSSIFLLVCATLIALTSFFASEFPIAKSLAGDLILGYGMLALGCVSMWLCFQARQRSDHKGMVLFYTVILAPFAFGIPAWVAVLWWLFKSGRYNGPMP